MKRNRFLLITAILMSSALALSACGKSDSEVDKDSVIMENIVEDSDYGVNTLQFAGYTVTADMDEIMANGSKSDHFEADQNAEKSGSLGFITEKPQGDGMIRINGSIYLGSPDELFDYDEETYYTDEDYEKIAEDPEFVPEVTLPSVEDMMELSMEAFDGSKLGTDKIGGVDMTTGHGCVILDNGRGMLQYLAYGKLDGAIIYIDVTADVIDCTDSEAQTENARGFIENWISGIVISKS